MCADYLEIELIIGTRGTLWQRKSWEILADLHKIAVEKVFFFLMFQERDDVIIRHRVTSCIILAGMVILSLPRFTSTVFIGFSRPTTFLYSTPEKNVSSLLFEEVTSRARLFLPSPSLSLSLFFFLL